MYHDLAALFAEEPAATTLAERCRKPSIHSAADKPTAKRLEDDTELGGVALPESESIGGRLEDSGLPFGMKVDTYAEDTIKSLLETCDDLRNEIRQQKKDFEKSERLMYRNAMSDIDLPAKLARRLHRLESEVEREQIENLQLREDLKLAKNEVSILEDQSVGQKNKIKGAGKKVRNAKDVALKSEEKAKHATHDKQLRISSERKMKEERNEAFAKVAWLTKQCDDLQSDLQIETSGRPHLRKVDSSSDEATAVIPIEIKILRSHFVGLSTVFESNQISITEEMQRWYDDWKKPKESVRQVVGANYVNSDRKSGRAPVDLAKLYADMVELVDGHQQTGAEHDGPRSKHSLETICRTAEERHNSQL